MSKDEWMARVNKSGSDSLASAPMNIKDDIDIVRAAVSKNGSAIRYASDRLRDDKELAMLAIGTLNHAYTELSPQRDPEYIMRIIVGIAPHIFFFLSPRLQQDPEVAIRLITIAPGMFTSLSPRLQQEPEIAMRLITIAPGMFTSLSPRLQQEPEIAMWLITFHPRKLAMIAPALQTNRGFISEAIRQNPEVFNYMPDVLKRDMDFVIDIVAKNKRVVPFISKEIKDQLSKHISELKNSHSLHELMNSAGVKHKRGFLARKEALSGERSSEMTSDEDLARADAAEAAVAPAHSKLFAHNKFHAQNLGMHMAGFLERAHTRHDWATVVLAAENLGIYEPKIVEKEKEKPKAAKKCEDGESQCSIMGAVVSAAENLGIYDPKAAKKCEDGESQCSIMGGKKRRTQKHKKYKRKTRRYI